MKVIEGEKGMNRWKTTLTVSVTIISYSLFSLYFILLGDIPHYSLNDYWGMFLFLVLLFLMVSFPMHIKGTSIVFLHAVTVAIFLQFGILVEVVISQLAIVFALFKLRATWERYPMNGFMYLITSVGAATVFFALGGDLNLASNEIPEIQLIPIVGYILASIFINHVILYLITTKLRGQKKEILGKELWWEVIPVLLISPTGILIYILYSQLNWMIILYVMIPIVTFSIIFRLYNRLDIVNEKLKAINETGNVMTGKLNVDHVTNEFVKAIEKLVPYQYCTVFKMDERSNVLLPIKIAGVAITPEVSEKFMSLMVEVGDGLSGQVAARRKSITIGHEQDVLHYKNEPDFFFHQNSVLSVPLIRSDQVIGVITLSHSEHQKYTKEDATLVEILANQAAIAFKNADEYEETKRKSEVDELTGLYNYRYFEHVLFEQMESAKRLKGQLSLILLDIDHFKTFNDTFGHLAGNKILQTLAKLIKDEVGDAGLVTRYGGEEFTILLPNVDQQMAYQRAESLRQRIEKTSLQVESDLEKGEEKNRKEEVHITVSLGVATYPEHADDPLSLVRHADRAMYIGAKRKGRNKVAVYQIG
jgi:two-component system cell cycle response regulator